MTRKTALLPMVWHPMQDSIDIAKASIGLEERSGGSADEASVLFALDDGWFRDASMIVLLPRCGHGHFDFYVGSGTVSTGRVFRSSIFAFLPLFFVKFLPNFSALP